MQFTPERTAQGWRLEIAQNGHEPVVLDVVGWRLAEGAVRAAVTVTTGDTVISHDLVTLTAAQARARFLAALAEKGAAVPDQALVALDVVCRESADVSRPAASPCVDSAPANDPAAARPLAELLEALVALLTRYIVFRLPAQPIALALWILHTHCLDAFDTTAYAYIRSAQKQSGKTRLLELLEELVPRPWRIVEPSAATVFRKIERDRPVVIIDEVDAIFKDKGSESAEALRGVLNAGYRRGAVVPRCVGKNFDQLKDFGVFCAKVFAGLGRLPDTTADRAITLVLARRKKSERVARFRFRTITQETALLRRALARWATAAIPALREARPPLPETLDDRAAEIWEPLLAIADAAGGRWPEEARRAAKALHDAVGEEESLGVLLLRAIRETFEARDKARSSDADSTELFKAEREKKSDAIPSVDLLVALVNREGEPWAGWWQKELEWAAEKGKSPNGPAGKLATLLRPFEVQSRDLWTSEGSRKGYFRADFADAFERYLSAAPDEGREAARTVGAHGFAASRPASGADRVTRPESHGAQRVSRPRDVTGGEATPAPFGIASHARDAGFPAPRCPRCGHPEWIPVVEGGWGSCARCGPVPTLDGLPSPPATGEVTLTDVLTVVPGAGVVAEAQPAVWPPPEIAQTTPADPAAAALLAQAAALAYPCVPLRPGVTVLGTGWAWGAFVATASVADRAAAATYLAALGEREPGEDR